MLRQRGRLSGVGLELLDPNVERECVRRSSEFFFRGPGCESYALCVLLLRLLRHCCPQSSLLRVRGMVAGE